MTANSIVRTPAYRAARDAWHAYYCGEDRPCRPGDHCAGAPGLDPLKAALEAALPHLVAAAVHEAYVNAQRAVTEIEWGAGSEHYRHGRETMQEDAVRAIRTAAEEARNG